MKNLLKKELKLAASPLTWIFLAAVFFTFIPGYPILMGAFFVCLGIFYTFQNGREANDILYGVLLPVAKKDIVAAKYAFVCLVQGIAFLLTAALTAVRMTALAGAAVYQQNPLMNANPVFLAFVLLIFAAFNVFFLGGHFRNAYALGIPFLIFCIVALLLVSVAEALPHLPGLAFLHTPGGERLGTQFVILLAAAALYAAATLLSCRASQRRFERTDL